jgi:hypothetical protein
MHRSISNKNLYMRNSFPNFDFSGEVSKRRPGARPVFQMEKVASVWCRAFLNGKKSRPQTLVGKKVPRGTAAGKF